MPKTTKNNVVIPNMLQLPIQPQPFCWQKGGQRQRTKTLFKRLLLQISGHDPESLLAYYFASRDGKKMV
jgi:hypothetical protein